MTQNLDQENNNKTIQYPECFGFLSNKQLEIVNNSRLDIFYRAGETICKQGTFASHILFLRKGLAKVYIESKDKNLILSIAPAGQFIGLTALFTDSTFHYSAAAYEDCEVCLLDSNMMKSFIFKNPKLGADIIRKLNESTIRSYDRIFSLSKKNIPGRFSDLILYLSEKIYQSDSFSFPFSRKEMAELASMSIESLSRVIRDFNRDGSITLKGKNIEIHDKDKLKKISLNG